MYDSNDNNAYGGYVFDRKTGQYTTKQSTTLTQEEYARLSKQDSVFSLALSETDVIRSFCNHRNLEGTADTLLQEPDGTVRCWLCNYKFSPVDPSMTKDDVQDAVNLITDILQTIKMLFIDMPISAQREYFQIIPLIEKVPQLFELAARNFSKHENYNAWGYKNANMNTMNMFNMLSNVLGGGMGAAPNMGMGQSYSNMGNPVFGAFGTPMGAPNGVAPNMGGMMMGGAPNVTPSGYNPQTTGYAYGMESEEEKKKREEEEAKKRAATVSGTATFTA